MEFRSATPGLSAEQVKARVLRVHETLCHTYNCPVAFFHNLDPLSELISSLLSHRTKNSASGKAFRQLRAQYPKWEMLMIAPTDEIERQIKSVTWPEQKAPRIQKVLKQIYELRDGSLDLGFLKDLSENDAQAWLEQIPGVGPKTSAAVLIFSSLRMRALPVDSHHHRVAARLGWIPESMGPGPAHQILKSYLPSEWSAQSLYDHHEIMMFHGQKCCYFHRPACERCPVLSLCPTGQKRRSSHLEDLFL